VALVAAGLVLAPGCGGESTEESPAVERARTVVRDVFDEKYAKVRRLFAEGLSAALSEEQLEQDQKSFLKLKGAYRSQGDAEVVERDGFTVVDIDLVMEKDPGVARVSFDADGMIAGLFFLASDIPVP
jgi:hypothetical protein